MRVLILNLSAVPAMDITGLVALESALLRLRQQGVLTLITGVRPQPESVLRKAGVQEEPGRVQFCATLNEAAQAAAAVTRCLRDIEMSSLEFGLLLLLLGVARRHSPAERLPSTRQLVMRRCRAQWADGVGRHGTRTGIFGRSPFALPVIGGFGSRDAPFSITNACSSEYHAPATSGAGAGSFSWRT